MNHLVRALAVLLLFLSSDLQAKTIVVLMDGTWNEPEFETNGGFPQGDETNVEKLRSLLDSDGQLVLYFAGIGTDGKRPERVRDGAFGTSASKKVDEAYQRVVEKYRVGDELAIFGFSRGAATARMLARKVRSDGVQGNKVSIRFLGLWDTVAALGVPIPDLESFRKQYHDADERLRVPDNVRHVTHLVSVDEDRALFTPTLVSCDSPQTTINEVWFPGNHGDVGGGWKKTMAGELQLSDTTLAYMIRDAKSPGHDIKFKENWVRLVVAPTNGQGRIHRVELSDPTQFLGGQAPRPLASAGSPKPRVHRSVKQRFDGDPSYRPPQFKSGFQSVELVD